MDEYTPPYVLEKGKELEQSKQKLAESTDAVLLMLAGYLEAQRKQFNAAGASFDVALAKYQRTNIKSEETFAKLDAMMREGI